MAKRKTKTASKKKVAPVSKIEENFHIGIKEPIPLRRNILESVKIVVQAMQQFEKLKNIRSKKKALIGVLHKDIREVTRLMNSLKAVLPATNYKPPAPKVMKMPKQEVEEKPKKMPPVHKSEIDRLQDELNDIENQLNNLG